MDQCVQEWERKELPNINTNIFFSHLDSEERSEICDALVQLSAQPGDVIIRQGDEGDTFYIIDLVMDLPIYTSHSI